MRLGIGAKLGLSIGVGIVLIAGIIAWEHFSSRVVARLVAAADNQQAIVLHSLTIEVMLQGVQIAGRDLRKAQTADQIKAQLTELQQIADQARAKTSALQDLAPSDETQKSFNKVSELTLSYIEALREIGAQQAEILSLFQTLDEIEAVWVRSFHQLVNSAEFSLLSNVPIIEALVNEFRASFMDARAATWRYFVLNEQSQVLRITSGADAASEKLDYAKRDLKDPKVIELANRLQAVVPEYIAALKSTITAIDAQNRIQDSDANSFEGAARSLLQDIEATATKVSDEATRKAIAGAEWAERLRIGVRRARSPSLLVHRAVRLKDDRSTHPAHRRRADAAHPPQHQHRHPLRRSRRRGRRHGREPPAAFKDSLLRMDGNRSPKAGRRSAGARATQVRDGATGRPV